MDNECPVCGSPRAQGVSQCASCGYRFVDATQQFQPIKVIDQSPAREEAPAANPTLRVIRGPQIGMVFSLDRAVTSIGRKPQCDIFLNDMTVSREHALIASTGNGYVITDRKSYNGVWVNNEACERRVLVDGDHIQVGTFCLVFEV